jgi:hypothetical protein
MRITPITTKDIIRYYQAGSKVIDSFTNKVLYNGNNAPQMLLKINKIGLLNASIIDSGSKAKFLSLVA